MQDRTEQIRPRSKNEAPDHMVVMVVSAERSNVSEFLLCCLVACLSLPS